MDRALVILAWLNVSLSEDTYHPTKSTRQWNSPPGGKDSWRERVNLVETDWFQKGEEEPQVVALCLQKCYLEEILMF